MTDLGRHLANTEAAVAHIHRLMGEYTRRYHDFRRGGYPTSSLPTFGGGGTIDSPALEQDPVDNRINRQHTQILRAMQAAQNEARKVEALMLWLVRSVDMLEDPEPLSCGNPECPDSRVFTMIGRDRPQDGQKRCDPCRKFYARNQRERTVRNYVLRDEKVVKA